PMTYFSVVYTCCPHRNRHSFPTRRSSDLRRSRRCSTSPRTERLKTGTCIAEHSQRRSETRRSLMLYERPIWTTIPAGFDSHGHRSEEHTSELQSHLNLVCRLLLEKKKIKK